MSSLENLQLNRQDNTSEPLFDQFLVCGLGNLGQHCVTALKAMESK